MRFSSTFSFSILPIIFAVIINCNTLISQAPLIVKSALTQSGSRAVSFEHTDANGVLKITKVQQSIGQNGMVGLSKTPNHSVQQGYLNRIRTLNINNTTVEFIELMDLVIYPNPFRDFINIKFSNPTIHPIQIEVFDLRGRLVLDNDYPPSLQITVSMERLEDASYVVRISSGSMAFLKKLIKAKVK